MAVTIERCRDGRVAHTRLDDFGIGIDLNRERDCSAVLLDQRTRDEREAEQLVGSELMPELRRATYAWSLRKDVQAAVYAVSGLLMDAPENTSPGIPIERSVYAAINPRTRPIARPA